MIGYRKPKEKALGARGTAHERGYDYRWQKASKRFLRENPLCADCLERGRTEAATLVDHIIPHRGDMTIFWDKTNLQGLCVQCHGRKTAAGR